MLIDFSGCWDATGTESADLVRKMALRAVPDGDEKFLSKPFLDIALGSRPPESCPPLIASMNSISIDSLFTDSRVGAVITTGVMVALGENSSFGEQMISALENVLDMASRIRTKGGSANLISAFRRTESALSSSLVTLRANRGKTIEGTALTHFAHAIKLGVALADEAMRLSAASDPMRFLVTFLVSSAPMRVTWPEGAVTLDFSPSFSYPLYLRLTRMASSQIEDIFSKKVVMLVQRKLTSLASSMLQARSLSLFAFSNGVAVSTALDILRRGPGVNTFVVAANPFGLNVRYDMAQPFKAAENYLQGNETDGSNYESELEPLAKPSGSRKKSGRTSAPKAKSTTYTGPTFEATDNEGLYQLLRKYTRGTVGEKYAKRWNDSEHTTGAKGVGPSRPKFSDPEGFIKEFKAKGLGSWIPALIIESGLNPYAVNESTGALGLVQLNNDTHGGVTRNAYARNVKDTDFLIDLIVAVDDQYGTGDAILNAWKNFLPYPSLKAYTKASFIKANPGYTLTLFPKADSTEAEGVKILHPLAFGHAFASNHDVTLNFTAAAKFMRGTYLQALKLPESTRFIYYRFVDDDKSTRRELDTLGFDLGLKSL